MDIGELITIRLPDDKAAATIADCLQKRINFLYTREGDIGNMTIPGIYYCAQHILESDAEFDLYNTSGFTRRDSIELFFENLKDIDSEIFLKSIDTISIDPVTKKEVLVKSGDVMLGEVYKALGDIEFLLHELEKCAQKVKTDQQGTLELSVAVENTQESEKSDFMIFLKVKNEKAYNAMKKALGKWILYENGKFDFRCKIGTVGQFFLTVDFIEQEDREIIAKYITIFGESTTAKKLKNAYGNTPPDDWEQMENEIFNTAEYM